jgi:hypothetical protein
MTVSTVAATPVLHGVYQHRMADIMLGGARRSSDEVIVLAVTHFRTRTCVTIQYVDHRPGRRDFAALTLDEFRSTYPTLLDTVEDLP